MKSFFHDLTYFPSCLYTPSALILKLRQAKINGTTDAGQGKNQVEAGIPGIPAGSEFQGPAGIMISKAEGRVHRAV